MSCTRKKKKKDERQEPIISIQPFEEEDIIQLAIFFLFLFHSEMMMILVRSCREINSNDKIAIHRRI
jgi:hypothetical protein